ncbi:MAG: biopolymer transporter ExbD [Planctomycetes bacterium]|nr:biopolymer transporter ExbD [Planctomycetota bacterium]
MGESRARLNIAAQGDVVDLPLTPMIDIVFQLLIFFLLTMSFHAEEGYLQAWLPRDRGLSSANPPPHVTQVRVTLDFEPTENRCRALLDFRTEVEPIYDAELKSNAPDWSYIDTYIRRAKEGYAGLGDQGLPVTIDFSERTPVKFVVRVVDICTGAGIKDISFAAPEIPF